MYKESEVNLDDIVKALLESELGFLLLQSDNNCKNMYDVLSEKSTYEDRIGMFGYNTHITYAIQDGMTLNKYVEEALQNAISAT